MIRLTFILQEFKYIIRFSYYYQIAINYFLFFITIALWHRILYQHHLMYIKDSLNMIIYPYFKNAFRGRRKAFQQ